MSFLLIEIMPFSLSVEFQPDINLWHHGTSKMENHGGYLLHILKY